MSDLLTLPASDLVARIAALEAEVARLRGQGRCACRFDEDENLVMRCMAHKEVMDAAHNAALEAAAEIADGWSTHVGAAIRGLRR